MPPDDWLCQNLEELNTVVAEGYPSRAQDSAEEDRKDQFVKVPKSQSRRYQMHTIKPKGPHRPGKTLFSWHNTEEKVKSQFPALLKPLPTRPRVHHKPPVLLQDPVRVLRSRPDGDPLIGSGHMTRKSIGLPVRGTRNNKLGGNLVAIEEGVVAEVVAPNPVSPGHKVTSITNDKYHLYPTAVFHRLEKSLCQRKIQTVNSSMLDSLVLKVVKSKNLNHKVQQT